MDIQQKVKNCSEIPRLNKIENTLSVYNFYLIQLITELIPKHLQTYILVCLILIFFIRTLTINLCNASIH